MNSSERAFKKSTLTKFYCDPFSCLALKLENEVRGNMFTYYIQYK